MLTFYHSPQSRSSRLLSLILELGVEDQINIQTVTVARNDGSGGADPNNPHPEGKVPILDHDGTLIRETTAIALYLTDLFPKAGLGPTVGDPLRGAYLSWLAWYSGVLEPVLVHQAAGLEHPFLTATFRGFDEAAAHLNAALKPGPWLLGDRFSAADIVIHSPFSWFPEAVGGHPKISEWVARCAERSAAQAVLKQDAA
jgi:glutathione S-transferase